MRTTLATALFLLTLAMTSGTGKADTQTAPEESRDRDQFPIGTWSAAVVVDGTQFPQATMLFNTAGSLSIATPVSLATGVWHRTGTTTFDWEGREVYQPGPGLPGYVLINQHAALDGDTLTSSGESKVYDQDGNFWKTVHTVVTGTLSS
ncbi:MAG TPA: hypothetical protein VFB06_25100 [Streptosporangiaceae bacterium]|nr:hypothetical protein [Streptosporangiaceae bacterium]